MSSEMIQIAVAVATLVVIVVGVTVAFIELRQEVLARRLQGMSALFAEIWPEQMSSATWVLLLNVKRDEELTPEQVDLLPVVVSHYNRLGFLLYQGLVKDREVLGYPPFGILAAELFSLMREHLVKTTFLDSNMRENAIWWEYLALRANAYWESDGRAMMAGIKHYDAEPMGLMRDWATVMTLRTNG
jgi:hypothetical protein